MAEEKKERKEKKSSGLMADGLDWILVLLLAVILWRGLAGSLDGSGNFFNRFFSSLNPFSSSAPLNSFYLEKNETPIGKMVFDKENSKTGKIVYGPEFRAGKRYWLVNYD